MSFIAFHDVRNVIDDTLAATPGHGLHLFPEILLEADARFTSVDDN